jgi:TetR/AcrR family transcriptional repressor of nem operon
MQAVLQGGFVLAKAGNDPVLARESLDHLERYIRHLFNAMEDDAHDANDPDRLRLRADTP